MLNNFNTCEIEIPKAEERKNGGDALLKELRLGIFQNFRKTTTHKFKKLSKTQAG